MAPALSLQAQAVRPRALDDSKATTDQGNTLNSLLLLQQYAEQRKDAHLDF